MAKTNLFFAYEDTHNDKELFEYNGTSFTELTSDVASSEGGVYPLYLDAFGNELIFQATVAAGVEEIGVVNGNPKDNRTILNIKGADPGWFDPSYFFTYKGMVLFDGAANYDGGPAYGLWVTKGTAKTTFELGGADNGKIKNVDKGDGLLAYRFGGFTLFRGIVYFAGTDEAGNVGLWRTNGTPQGTYELAPISGAFESGRSKLGTETTDIQPESMCAVGDKMFFRGEDTSDSDGALWVTNGTAKGTYEVGGQANKGVKYSPAGNAKNLPAGMAPNDIIAFDGKAMFAAVDNTVGGELQTYKHTVGLWVSNGTAGGTTEIGGRGSAAIKDANKALDGGLLGGIENPDFTVFGKEVLFVGRDKDDHVGLWVTNGAVNGTHEVGGLDNAGIAGGLTLGGDNNSPDFTYYDGKIFFTGESFDSRTGYDVWQIWSTNGAAGGTHPVIGTVSKEPNTDFTKLTL